MGEYLINKYADVNIRNNEGLTPFFLAVIKVDYYVMYLLLNYSANINIKDNNE